MNLDLEVLKNFGYSQSHDFAVEWECHVPAYPPLSTLQTRRDSMGTFSMKL